MRHIGALVVLLAPLACGEPFSNDVFEDDARFIEAAPRMRVFRLSRGLGEDARFPLLAAEPAVLYTATRAALMDVDEHALSLLREIDDLVEAPPDYRAVDARAWSPPRGALDPLESRLSVTRQGATMSATLTRRRPGGAWRPLITAEAEDEATRGAFHLDLDAAAALGLGSTRGQVEVRFNREATRLRMALSFSDYQPRPEASPYDTYMIFEIDDEAGLLDYGFPDEDGGWIDLRARWLNTGAGRAQAALRGEVELIWEACWDASFQEVYAASGGVEGGGASACAIEAL
ncbi:hypothetical protein KKF91_01425 [Myxococcota bacterium]|nr:hypothetical protein [Myxococcota bacterium]MBU1429197.1 hypothetical protein [Myxococcota bacterium]MBU1899693.1 hypothetical protein [Myxococcota bacterium]